MSLSIIDHVECTRVSPIFDQYQIRDLSDDDNFQISITSNPNFITNVKNLSKEQLNKWFEKNILVYKNPYILNTNISKVDSTVSSTTRTWLLENYIDLLSEDQLIALVCDESNRVVRLIPKERFTIRVAGELALHGSSKNIYHYSIDIWKYLVDHYILNSGFKKSYTYQVMAYFNKYTRGRLRFIRKLAEVLSHYPIRISAAEADFKFQYDLLFNQLENVENSSLNEELRQLDLVSANKYLSFNFYIPNSSKILNDL